MCRCYRIHFAHSGAVRGTDVSYNQLCSLEQSCFPGKWLSVQRSSDGRYHSGSQKNCQCYALIVEKDWNQKAFLLNVNGFDVFLRRKLVFENVLSLLLCYAQILTLDLLVPLDVVLNKDAIVRKAGQLLHLFHFFL